jgi:hypothetical protein
VVSSVAAPISSVAFGAGAADEVPACCEVDSFGIDDVVSAIDPLTWAVALGLAVIPSAAEEDRSVSPGLNDDALLAAKGLGLGIGIANAAAGRAVLADAATCCVG